MQSLFRGQDYIEITLLDKEVLMMEIDRRLEVIEDLLDKQKVSADYS